MASGKSLELRYMSQPVPEHWTYSSQLENRAARRKRAQKMRRIILQGRRKVLPTKDVITRSYHEPYRKPKESI